VCSTCDVQVAAAHVLGLLAAAAAAPAAAAGSRSAAKPAAPSAQTPFPASAFLNWALPQVRTRHPRTVSAWSRRRLHPSACSARHNKEHAGFFRRQVRGDNTGAALVLIAMKEFLMDANRDASMGDARRDARGAGRSGGRPHAAGVPLVEVAPYGVAMLEACKRVLESGDTPYATLPPLLAVLSLAAVHHASFAPRFQQLTDLLLGWALEPALPPATRVPLLDTFAAFGSHWAANVAFTCGVAHKVLRDFEALADEACAGDGVAVAPRLVAFAACLAAVAAAAGEALTADAAPLLARFVTCCAHTQAQCPQMAGGEWARQVLATVATLADVAGEPALAPHYLAVLTVLFAALHKPVPSAEMQLLLESNLGLLERQRLWVKAEAVTAMMSTVSPLVALRRHPRRAVAAAAARTYAALLWLPAAAEVAHAAVVAELQGHLTALAETDAEEEEEQEEHVEGALFALAALAGGGVSVPRDAARRVWQLTAPLAPPVSRHAPLQLAAVRAVRALSSARPVAPSDDTATADTALPTQELAQRLLRDGVRAGFTSCLASVRVDTVAPDRCAATHAGEHGGAAGGAGVVGAGGCAAQRDGGGGGGGGGGPGGCGACGGAAHAGGGGGDHPQPGGGAGGGHGGGGPAERRVRACA
jgi:hypothetical protein